MCEYAWTSFQGNAKIIEISQLSKWKDRRFHPTQKPVELYAWLIRNFAKSGDTIFDPMMGSQSSRIAAYKMGFDYVGCELEKLYFDKGNERFARECLGETKTSDGKIIKQLTLFQKNFWRFQKQSLSLQKKLSLLRCLLLRRDNDKDIKYLQL